MRIVIFDPLWKQEHKHLYFAVMKVFGDNVELHFNIILAVFMTGAKPMRKHE